jgi:dihydroneopterin aldolase
VGTDHVRLNDIVLFAHLGVSEAERAVGQRIHLDLDLEVDLARAGTSDALADTVNYEAVYQLVESVVEGSRHRLLEALATSIIERLFGEFRAGRIRLRIRKPNVPFAGSLASAEVELVRER